MYICKLKNVHTLYLRTPKLYVVATCTLYVFDVKDINDLFLDSCSCFHLQDLSKNFDRFHPLSSNSTLIEVCPEKSEVGTST